MRKKIPYDLGLSEFQKMTAVTVFIHQRDLLLAGIITLGISSQSLKKILHAAFETVPLQNYFDPRISEINFNNCRVWFADILAQNSFRALFVSIDEAHFYITKKVNKQNFVTKLNIIMNSTRDHFTFLMQLPIWCHWSVFFV